MNLEKIKDFVKFSIMTGRLVIVPYGLSIRWCNNNCDFCYLKAGWENKIQSLDFFKRVTKDVITTMREILPTLPKNIIIDLDYAGGEIFCVNDEYYQTYYELLDGMYELCQANNLKMVMNLSTNLIYGKDYFDKLVRLYQYGEKLGVTTEITTSFDLWGRFKSEEALNQWWDNFQQLGNIMTDRPQVEMVLSKPSIDLYMQDADIPEMKVFNQILEHPDKYMFFFENYVPNNPENIKYVPSNADKINLHKKLIDKYSDKLDFLQAYVPRDDDLQYTDKGLPKLQDCSSAFYGTEEISNWPSDILFSDKDTPLYNITNCIDRAIGLWPESASSQFKDKTQLLKEGAFLGEGYMCLDHIDAVNSFFYNTFGCGICKYKHSCYKHNLRGCYVEHNFIWSESKCWKKEVFKYMEKKKKHE